MFYNLCINNKLYLIIKVFLILEIKKIFNKKKKITFC